MRIYVKGAPDVLLAHCTTELTGNGAENVVQDLTPERISAIEEANENMAKQALRVLAFAYKDSETADFSDPEQVENNLTFIGLTGMIDPPRPEAKEAIRLSRKAGIRPVMITGDHKTTAVAIAEEIGILTPGMRAVTGAELEAMSDEELQNQVEEIGVYARVAPEHKSHCGCLAEQRQDSCHDR